MDCNMKKIRQLTKEYLDEACSDQLSSESSLSFQTTHLLIDQYPSVIAAGPCKKHTTPQ